MALLLCVLASRSTAVRADVFVFVYGSSHCPFIYSIDRESACVDLTFILYSWWEDFRFFWLATLPWHSTVALSPPLHVDRPQEFTPEAALEDLGLPQWVPGWRWCNCLGFRDPGSTRYAGEPGVIGAGDTVLLGFVPSFWQLCPSEDWVRRWCSCLDLRDPGGAKSRGIPAALGARAMALLESFSNLW